MDYQHIESSQRQHHNELLFQQEQTLIGEKLDLNIFSILKPSIKKDGNQWCVLYGENIQEGICGFGDTPYKAILSFNGEWYKSLKQGDEK